MMGVSIATFSGKHEFVMHCDFCGKAQTEVEKLIASPNGSHICNECVDVCCDIIRTESTQ